EETTATRIGEKLAQPINRLVPPSAAESRKLQKKLMHAGYFSSRSPMIYRALQLATLVGFPLIVTLVFMVWGYPLSEAYSWVIGAVGAGYLLPRIILDNKIKGRQLRLQWGLADALDLLVISIEAGLGLNAAMVRVSEELKGVHPDICKEFEMVNLQLLV